MKIFRTLALAALAWALSPSPSLFAISFDEVREYGEVFRISASAPARDTIEVSWEIEPQYYLYNNRFLKFTAVTEGVVLGEPILPRGKISFDELLGEEVEKYHGALRVTVPLDSVPPGVDAVELRVRSQGCLENELCYPPSEQAVLVTLPAGGAGLGVLGALAGAGGMPGATREQALAPEEAFVYEAIPFDERTVLVRFTAQPGYYLYTERFRFSVVEGEGVRAASAELPDAIIKDDPEFGPVPVYFGTVEIPLRLERPAGGPTDIGLQAEFQGCRDGDICYPPMTRVIRLSLPAAGEAEAAQPVAMDETNEDGQGAIAPLSEQDRLARLLTQNPAAAILAFMVAGLLLAFTPCVFPMVPILSGIIAGQGDRLTTGRALLLSVVYVLAMAVTYTIAGVLAGLFGQNLQAVFQNPWILGGFVLVFIALAFSMFGFFELQLPSALQTRLSQASNRQRGGELWGVAVMGFLSALIVGPCVAPPLMAALIVIGSSGDAVLGGAALFALSIGMGLPLIAFGVSAGKLIPKAGPWMDAVKNVFGVGLLALAIWMLERIVPGGVIMLLWGALALGCGVYLGALERLEPGASGWRRLWKSLGVLLLVVGTLEIVGAAAGGDNWLRPLERLGQGGTAQTAEHVAFERVKSLDDLERAVGQAAANGRGAMFDFYADWCVECIRMERNTFPEPRVAALLERMDLVQADVTANDDTDQELMRAHGVIGPPAILFFDRSGREMAPYRLVGYFSPDEFAAHLERVLAAQ